MPGPGPGTEVEIAKVDQVSLKTPLQPPKAQWGPPKNHYACWAQRTSESPRLTPEANLALPQQAGTISPVKARQVAMAMETPATQGFSQDDTLDPAEASMKTDGPETSLGLASETLRLKAPNRGPLYTRPQGKLRPCVRQVLPTRVGSRTTSLQGSK